MKKKKIEFDWWEAVVEIDDKPETIEVMREQLLFWMGGQERINAAKGDIELAFLKMLGQFAINESIGHTLEGVLCAIDDTEGWASLRGKYGVKLISVDSWEFEESEFMVTNITS